MYLTENGDVPDQKCISSSGMGMYLTRNAHPHRECISSQGMHVVYTEWIWRSAVSQTKLTRLRLSIADTLAIHLERCSVMQQVCLGSYLAFLISHFARSMPIAK